MRVGDAGRNAGEVACTASTVAKQILLHVLAREQHAGRGHRVRLQEAEIEMLDMLGDIRPSNSEDTVPEFPPLPRHSSRHEDTPQTTGEVDMDFGQQHIRHFIRHHTPGDGLRVVASVLFATVGVIESKTGVNAETLLIKAVESLRTLEDMSPKCQRGDASGSEDSHRQIVSGRPDTVAWPRQRH